MKRTFLLAFALMVGVGGAIAQTLPAAKQEGTYTYYLENACDVAVTCRDEADGPACAQEFSGLTVYDSPSCLNGHEVAVVLGKIIQ